MANGNGKTYNYGRNLGKYLHPPKNGNGEPKRQQRVLENDTSEETRKGQGKAWGYEGMSVGDIIKEGYSRRARIRRELKK